MLDRAAARGDELASGWAASLTMGAGQFCTNPGIAVVIAGDDASRFIKAAASALEKNASADNAYGRYCRSLPLRAKSRGQIGRCTRSTNFRWHCQIKAPCPTSLNISYSAMPTSVSFRYFKTSPEIIQLAVMLYVRFPLSLRNVEDLFDERGVYVSYGESR